MALDMHLALHDARVGPRALREWAPYLTNPSRQQHKRELVTNHLRRTWDYYTARREWMDKSPREELAQS